MPSTPSTAVFSFSPPPPTRICHFLRSHLGSLAQRNGRRGLRWPRSKVSAGCMSDMHSFSLPQSVNLYQISTLSLFFLALTAWMTRIAIKARIQSEFGADEGLLLFAIIAFCAATGLFFSFVDQMYLVEAAIVGSLKVTPLDNATFHKSSSACLILLWTAVCGVKFSFLALFRKLVDRDCFLTSYWRWVLGLNIVVYAYGIAGFVLPCPYFKPPNSCTMLTVRL